MATDRPRAISSYFPYLDVRMMIGERTEDAEALVDTGFSGYLVVPIDFLSDQPPDGYSLWTVADGRQVPTPTYYGTVQIGNFDPVEAVIIALGNEPILGRGVTDHFRVIFDHGRQVIIEE